MTAVTITFYALEDRAELGKGSYITEAQSSEEFVKELEAMSIFDIPGYPTGKKVRTVYAIAQIPGLGTALINFADT